MVILWNFIPVHKIYYQVIKKIEEIPVRKTRLLMDPGSKRVTSQKSMRILNRITVSVLGSTQV